MLNMHSIVTLRSWSILISHHVVIFLYIYCEFNRLVEITLITSSSLDTSLAGLNVTQPRYLEKTAIEDDFLYTDLQQDSMRVLGVSVFLICKQRSRQWLSFIIFKDLPTLNITLLPYALLYIVL